MATARPRPQVMRLSEAAATRIKELMAKSDRPIAGLRVGVKNGGCAGMEYTMEYVDRIGPTDEVVEDKGVKILIDPKAVLFLLGTEMDWKVGQAVVAVHLQQSEPDLGLRLRRIRAADAGQGLRAPRRISRPCGAADPDFIIELFAGFGPVTVRRMFSGAGVFADGLMIALVVRWRDLSQGRRQLHPAVPARGRDTVQLQDPGRHAHADVVLADAGALYDEPDELAQWARQRPGGGQARGSQAIETEEGLKAEGQATLASAAAANSGSVSQITRLRPLRLAA